MKRYMTRVMLPVGIVALILVVGNRLFLSTSIQRAAPIEADTDAGGEQSASESGFEAEKEQAISRLLNRTEDLDATVTEVVNALPAGAAAAQDALDPLLNRINSERTGLMAIVSDMHVAKESSWETLQSNAQAQLNTLAKAVEQLEARVAEMGASSVK